METAYEQYAFAIGEYNTAQFDLYRALGQPAQWVTSLQQWHPTPTPVQAGTTAGAAAPIASAPSR